MMAEPLLCFAIKNISPACKRLNDICHCPTLWRRWSLQNVGCITYTKESLRNIFRHAKDFKYFYFGGDYEVSAREVSKYLSLCSNMESLDVGCNGLLKDLVFLSKMPHLKRLILDYCPEIRKDCFKKGLRGCSKLEHLSLLHCKQFSVCDILEVMDSVPGLKILNIEYVVPISSHNLHTILEKLPDLRQLQATPDNFHSDSWFAVMAEYRHVQYGVALMEVLSKDQRNGLLL